MALEEVSKKWRGGGGGGGERGGERGVREVGFGVCHKVGLRGEGGGKGTVYTWGSNSRGLLILFYFLLDIYIYFFLVFYFFFLCFILFPHSFSPPLSSFFPPQRTTWNGGRRNSIK